MESKPFELKQIMSFIETDKLEALQARAERLDRAIGLLRRAMDKILESEYQKRELCPHLPIIADRTLTLADEIRIFLRFNEMEGKK